jgi:hypothetical protein
MPPFGIGAEEDSPDTVWRIGMAGRTPAAESIFLLMPPLPRRGAHP